MLQKNKKTAGKALLDSSAIIALLKKEPGMDILNDVLATSCISAINLSEIVSVLARTGILGEEIDQIVNGLVPEIIPFSEDIAILAGKLIIDTQVLGLSLGDRACLATGIIYNLPIYTTDKTWAQLKLDCEIIVIR